jgi:large subunit ribosomal protein L11
MSADFIKVKLQIPAGNAKPSPPIGPALAPKGVNIVDFCKKFNEATSKMEAGTPVRVEVIILKNKTFTFTLKPAPTSFFIKKSAKLKENMKGSRTPGRDTAGTIDLGSVKEIAKLKMVDMGVSSLEAAEKMVIGSARSMGIKVVE